jgi:hypothetical protein
MTTRSSPPTPAGGSGGGKLVFQHGRNPDRRDSTPVVTVLAKRVVIHTPPGCEDYHITKGRIDTPMKLLHWVHHLTCKRWFSAQLVEELTREVCRHFGWYLYNGGRG